MEQLWIRTVRTASLATIVTLMAGCTAQLKESAGFSIADVLSQVTDASGTVPAQFHRGIPPAPAGGAAASVSGIGVMINGGSSQQNVSSGAAFTRVIVAADGLTDYFELTLPAGTTNQPLILSANPQASAGTVNFAYAVDGGTGLGAYAHQAVRFLQVGTGDIQVSVSWSGASDVDLHVKEPSGEETYYGHLQSSTGGTLDLDSNPACNLDNVNNENIVWPLGRAPHGTYTVEVHYYSDCGVPESDWVLTIQASGQAPQILSGKFVGLYTANTPFTTSFTY
ncbi:MAG TPA: hypothetical protein VNH46_02315 [Gemmatimonadales bacterium]|nr:hypothetical protein [Gemmatimonadales bacterium]